MSRCDVVAHVTEGTLATSSGIPSSLCGDWPQGRGLRLSSCWCTDQSPPELSDRALPLPTPNTPRL